MFYRPLFLEPKSEKNIHNDQSKAFVLVSGMPAGGKFQKAVEVMQPDLPVTVLPVETVVPSSQLEQVAGIMQVEVYRLSFYDPMIGRFFPDIASINCASWDVVSNDCKSTMANGQNFRDWYGKGLACPPGHELGDVLHVIYPEQLRGDWTCVDRGGLIEGDLLDFLLRYPDDIWTGYDLNNFPWASPVVVEVRR